MSKTNPEIICRITLFVTSTGSRWLLHCQLLSGIITRFLDFFFQKFCRRRSFDCHTTSHNGWLGRGITFVITLFRFRTFTTWKLEKTDPHLLYKTNIWSSDNQKGNPFRTSAMHDYINIRMGKSNRKKFTWTKRRKLPWRYQSAGAQNSKFQVVASVCILPSLEDVYSHLDSSTLQGINLLGRANRRLVKGFVFASFQEYYK